MVEYLSVLGSGRRRRDEEERRNMAARTMPVMASHRSVVARADVMGELVPGVVCVVVCVVYVYSLCVFVCVVRLYGGERDKTIQHSVLRINCLSTRHPDQACP